MVKNDCQCQLSFYFSYISMHLGYSEEGQTDVGVPDAYLVLLQGYGNV